MDLNPPVLEARLHRGFGGIDAASWDALVASDHPFLAHAFLHGLEAHGCIRKDLGWQSCPLGLYRNGQLVAASPLYLKDNSHGEFVFDWAWASSYARHGMDYYPKLLGAVPYSPVSGPRLLVGNASDSGPLRQSLIHAIEHCTGNLRLSSAHLNFVSEEDCLALGNSEWLPRFDWQFFWRNRGWTDFADFLGALRPKKRKNIAQERAHVRAAGVQCEVRHGDEMESSDWRTLHELYRATFDLHGNHPALSEAFFRHLGRNMPRQVMVVLCRKTGATVAVAFFLRSSDTLYGRYWGAREHIPGLHFEACYYQGIEYCIRHGLQRFEPGAQGEHKVARGFLPEPTRSFHRIMDSRFSQAIGDALQREARALRVYRAELLAHNPYRDASA